MGVIEIFATHTNRETTRSQQVAQFLQDMLQGVGPSVALGRDTTMLREILDKTAQRLDKDLKNQPDVEADRRRTIGKVYPDLGQYTDAEARLDEALALPNKLLGSKHLQVEIFVIPCSGSCGVERQKRFLKFLHAFSRWNTHI